MSKLKTSNSGILFVISSPSGAGKTTLVRKLLTRDRRLRKTVSHTTRARRPGEKHGRDYYYVSPATFQKMMDTGKFLEWAEVYGRRYGTSRAEVTRCLRGGHDAVLVIENQGAKNIRRIFKDAAFVAVLPPNLKELRRRLKNRGGDPDDLKRRLALARAEVRSLHWYDYRVVNDRLENAVSDLLCIIRAERLRRNRA